MIGGLGGQNRTGQDGTGRDRTAGRDSRNRPTRTRPSGQTRDRGEIGIMCALDANDFDRNGPLQKRMQEMHQSHTVHRH